VKARGRLLPLLERGEHERREGGELLGKNRREPDGGRKRNGSRGGRRGVGQIKTKAETQGCLKRKKGETREERSKNRHQGTEGQYGLE
jgi:hypothetical protein